MGGVNSMEFNYFRSLLCIGFMEVRKSVEKCMNIVQIMMESSELPCFKGLSIEKFRERFSDPLLEEDVNFFIKQIISHSLFIGCNICK